MQAVEDGRDIQQYVRPSTIAEKMDVSVDTVLDMAHKGELEAIKFRGQVRISLQSFRDYLASHHLEIPLPAEHDGDTLSAIDKGSRSVQ